MPSLIKISQQTFWQFVGKFITSVVTLIVLSAVARRFGEIGTGIFTLTTTYLGIFYLVADFGFNAYVLKRLKTQDLKLKTEWGKLLGTRIMWSVILLVLAVSLLPFWPFATPLFVASVILGSVDILASAIYTTCSLVFQSKLRYDLMALATIIGRALGLLVFLWLVLLRADIPVLVLMYLLGGILVAAFSLYFCIRLLKGFSIDFDFSYIKNLFLKSWPLALTLVLNVIYFRADAFMIATFRSSAEVGIYNVAYSLFQSALVLPTFIMNAYYPMLLKSFKDLKLVGLGLLGLAALGTIVTLAISPILIGLITGGGFAGSTVSLQILSLGFPAYFLSALMMWLLVVKQKYQVLLLVYSLGLVVNLLLNFMFIPTYSYIAASWVTVISEYLILTLQAVILIRTR